MSFRRMLPFVLLNIVVSAIVVLAILFWWDNREAIPEPGAGVTAVTPTIPIATANPAQITAAASTPESEPEDKPPVHVVKAGETLGSISGFYEVTLDDIMAANGLDNPNVLSVGQELIIPVGGLPTAVPPTETPVDNILPSPIPTEELVAEGEVNVEITAVTGVGRLTEEAVQISNFGGGQIALLGWELSDSNGHVFTFGQVTLFGDGAAIQVHTEDGQDGPADQYWELETPIWEPGEQVTLRDADSNVQATFTVP